MALRGRPRKSPPERRELTLRFLVRLDEYATIRQLANAARMSFSAYARAMCLNGQIVINQTRSLDADAFDQLRRIGVNLNQAVHKLNATGKHSPDLESAARAVEQFIFERIDDEAGSAGDDDRVDGGDED